MSDQNLKEFSVYKNNKLVRIPEDEYIEDNLLYHSLVHTLQVVSDKIDSLENKGYIFQKLKQQTNLFRAEFFKHTEMQINLMHGMGSGTFHNHTQKDFDDVMNFITEAKPAKITMLAKMMRESQELNNFTENDLVKSIESGEIEIEPENEGKSGMFNNKNN